MVRISKLTDYGVVIMAFMAGEPLRLFQAKEIAEHTAIAPPTVSKLLKILTKNKLLHSVRGTHGGYILATEPKEITIAMLVNALEGPIAITECSLGHDYCASAPLCSVKTPWLRINQAITHALQSVKLNDLIKVEPMEHMRQITYKNQRIEVSHVRH
ncbi:MAG TPA: SUF system Fe-S cluster assembly regulator [Gammaproteobacteria bacterium]|nr:SUF system Fe-S cluster assembly regulator [Gammaproteobacteria bacterium]